MLQQQVRRAHQWIQLPSDHFVECPKGHAAAEIQAWSDGICDVCGRDDVKQGEWITECNHCHGDRGFESSWYEMNWWRCRECTLLAGGGSSKSQGQGVEVELAEGGAGGSC